MPYRSWITGPGSGENTSALRLNAFVPKTCTGFRAPFPRCGSSFTGVRCRFDRALGLLLVPLVERVLL
jgi:hypothetical protein